LSCFAGRKANTVVGNGKVKEEPVSEMAIKVTQTCVCCKRPPKTF